MNTTLPQNKHEYAFRGAEEMAGEIVDFAVKNTRRLELKNPTESIRLHELNVEYLEEYVRRGVVMDTAKVRKTIANLRAQSRALQTRALQS